MKIHWNKPFRLTKSHLFNLGLALADIVSVYLAYYVSLLIRFYVVGENNRVFYQYAPAFRTFVPYYAVFCIAVFFCCRLYNRSWKYASTEDLNWILIANLITCVGHILGTCIFTMKMPRTYYLFGAIIQVGLTTATRLSYRMISLEIERTRIRFRNNQPLKRAMIIGIGDTAHQVLRHLKWDADCQLLPVCLVDYNSQNFDAIMEGIPVVHGIDAIRNAIISNGVESIILADSTMPGAVRKQVREICNELNLEVQDYIGYFQEVFGAIPINRMIEYASCEVELVINGIHRIFPGGRQAAQYITEQFSLKAIYPKENRLVIELQAPLTLMYITNDPVVAKIAEKNGVQRVWIDLETLGKDDRQKKLNTVKSHHTIQDIANISNVLTTSDVLVRVNPINSGSEEEINQAIAAGADIIMLPMWKSVDEVKQFLKFVNGRVKTTLLLETKEAAECLDQVLAMGGFDEVHIGLNDLHLSYGLNFMFEPLANGMVDALCKKIAAAGIPYGFGGIARIGEGALPAERIVKEHYRLGSTRVILSRSFCNTEEVKEIKAIEVIFAENIARLRNCEKEYTALSKEEFEENRKAVKRCVTDIVNKKKAQMQK